MNPNVAILKLIVTLMLVVVSFVLSYFNMVVTWGVELKSLGGFFFFMIATMASHMLMTYVIRIKE